MEDEKDISLSDRENDQKLQLENLLEESRRAIESIQIAGLSALVQENFSDNFTPSFLFFFV